jgi:hypothetical protein
MYLLILICTYFHNFQDGTVIKNVQFTCSKPPNLHLKMYQKCWRPWLHHGPRWGSIVSSPSGLRGGASARLGLGFGLTKIWQP